MKKDNNAQTCTTKRTSIGGQALIEGIMMRGPEISAMAVRNPDGEIVLEKWVYCRVSGRMLVVRPVEADR